MNDVKDTGYRPLLKDRSLPDDEVKQSISPGVLSQKPGVLLLPGGTVPSEALLAVTAVSSIFDLADFVNPEDPVILSIADADVLRCALEYPALFGDRFYVLEGFPGFEYKDYFVNATWGLPKVSYHSLAAEITFARELNAKAELAGQTVIERERKRVQRKSGFKKAFTGFEVEEVGAHPPQEGDGLPEEDK